MKKFLSVILSAAMVFAFTGCDGSDGDSGSDNSSGKETYNIGICQIMQHDALDSATQGFKDALTNSLGDKVNFDTQNAQGDSANCATIINQFVSNNVDLILANATAPLQSAAAGTTEIPILGTSVTDYAVALNISDWNGVTGRNISGTSDLAPLEQQAEMIKEIFPDKKKVGLLYCSAEPNSEYQIKNVSEFLEKDGYECKNFSFVDSNDIASVATGACDYSDIIYIPTDNTAASNTEVIKNICIPAKIPVVTGEEGICKNCGVVTLSINYYDLGYKTGEMAYKILAENKDITSMPVEYANNVKKKYNPEICETLGISIPDDYEKIE